MARAWLAALALVAIALPCGALPQTAPPRLGAEPPEDLPRELAAVAFEQRLDAELPLDAAFLDADGVPVRLGELFGGRPVLLVPAYYDCPMLCTLVLEGVAAAVRELPFDPGEAYEVVVFSFDPDDTPEAAASRKRQTLSKAGGRGSAAAWHFLTGEPVAIRRLTEAIGFRYTVDAESGELSHLAGVVVATPEGKVARYFFGIDYPPRDVRLALVEAANGRVGSLADQVLLYCFRYDPTTGRYSAFALGAVRLGGILTVGALAFGVVLMLRRERRRPPAPVGPTR